MHDREVANGFRVKSAQCFVFNLSVHGVYAYQKNKKQSE